MNRALTIAVAALLLQACGMMPRGGEDPTAGIDYGPVLPDSAYASAPAPGTIFNPAGSFDLFMDLRARAVGDILTIELVERTDASKESSSSAAKDTSVDTGIPIFAGRPITKNGTPILNNEIAGSRSFDGSADASQSNRLDGSITVTVAERLPNGNLLVRGEKLININQGEEYIRLQGIIRRRRWPTRRSATAVKATSPTRASRASSRGSSTRHGSRFERRDAEQCE
jgi:flagellar L-ring protein precursor FlgH